MIFNKNITAWSCEISLNIELSKISCPYLSIDTTSFLQPINVVKRRIRIIEIINLILPPLHLTASVSGGRICGPTG